MPRLTTPQGARPIYYDRNPAPQSGAYFEENIAPHAATERAARTIPSNTKGFVELAQVEVFIRTAASAAALRRAVIQYTPSGGAAVSLMQADIYTQENTVGQRQAHTVGGSMFLDAGDKIGIVTTDSSTGGTVSYNASFKITEFDA